MEVVRDMALKPSVDGSPARLCGIDQEIKPETKVVQRSEHFIEVGGRESQIGRGMIPVLVSELRVELDVQNIG